MVSNPPRRPPVTPPPVVDALQDFAPARRDVEDELCLSVRMGVDDLRGRWWRIRQPPPSVAFSLRGRIGACLGDTADWAVRNFLRVSDPQAEADLESDVVTAGEAMALAAFHRARSGRAVVDAGESADLATVRLLAVAGAVAQHAGGDLGSALLLGEHERVSANMEYRWAKPSLLHRLLLDSGLTYAGEGRRPMYPSGRPGEAHAGAGLWGAVNSGSIGEFVKHLDQVVTGPDELTLLCAWALLHLWRPF